MATIQEIRQQYPQYNDLSDQALADSMYAKHYSDMPKEDFYQKIGMSSPSMPEEDKLPTVDVSGNKTLQNAKGAATLLAPALFAMQGFTNPLEHAENTISGAANIPGKTIDLMKENYTGIGKGVDNAFNRESMLGKIKGVGSAALDALNLPFMPLQATVRKVYGEPVQKLTQGLANAEEVSLPIEIAAMPAFSKALSSPVKKIAHETMYKSIIPNADELRNVAGDLYSKADAIGGVLKPETVNNWIEKIQSVAPQTEEGRIISGNNAVTDMLEKVSALKDRPITLKAAQEIDEGIGDVIDNLVQNGRLTKEGKKLQDIQSEFRKTIEGASESDVVGSKEGFNALKQGRDVWAISRRMSDIERIVTRAEQSDNPASAMKAGFRTLFNNPSRMRGFSTEEKQMIENVAKSGEVTDLLKAFGGKLLPVVAAASGGGFTGTAAATAASLAAKGSATKLQVGRAEKLLEYMAKKASERAGLPIEAPRFSSMGTP